MDKIATRYREIFADKMFVTRMEENNETNLVETLSWKLGLEVGTALIIAMIFCVTFD